MKTGTYGKLNESFLKWFTSMPGNNIPINGPILLGKTHEFAKASITAILQIDRMVERLEGKINYIFLEF